MSYGGNGAEVSVLHLWPGLGINIRARSRQYGVGINFFLLLDTFLAGAMQLYIACILAAGAWASERKDWPRNQLQWRQLALVNGTSTTAPSSGFPPLGSGGSSGTQPTAIPTANGTWHWSGQLTSSGPGALSSASNVGDPTLPLPASTPCSTTISTPCTTLITKPSTSPCMTTSHPPIPPYYPPYYGGKNPPSPPPPVYPNPPHEPTPVPTSEVYTAPPPMYETKHVTSVVTISGTITTTVCPETWTPGPSPNPYAPKTYPSHDGGNGNGGSPPAYGPPSPSGSSSQHTPDIYTPAPNPSPETPTGYGPPNPQHTPILPQTTIPVVYQPSSNVPTSPSPQEYPPTAYNTPSHPTNPPEPNGTPKAPQPSLPAIPTRSEPDPPPAGYTGGAVLAQQALPLYLIGFIGAAEIIRQLC